MKYGDIIRGGVITENFRFLRQTSAGSLPWGDIHWQLWFRSSKTNWQLQSAYVISGGNMLHESPEICVQLMDNHERLSLVVSMPS